MQTLDSRPTRSRPETRETRAAVADAEPPPAPARPSFVRVWLLACRPHTLGASLVPVAVGTAVAYRGGPLDLASLIACVVAAISLQVSTNLANDAFDFVRSIDDARRLGPLRVTQAGWLSARQVFVGVGVAIGLAMLAGVQLVAAGGWPILAIGLISIVFALAYSGGPFPLASHGLGEVAAFVFFGVVAVMGSSYLHTGSFALDAFVVSLPVGCLVSAIMVVNNLRDIESDAATGKRTLAVRLGAPATRRVYVALIGSSYACAIPLALYLGSAWMLLPWLSIPLARATARSLVEARTGTEFNTSLAQTARLHGAHGVLLCLGLIL